MRFPVSPSPRLPTPLRFLLLAALSLLAIWYYLDRSSWEILVATSRASTSWIHPIDELISRAENIFDVLVANETTTLADTAVAYRQRRGRHPPPSFDRWFEFAQNNNVIIVEEFWDQIYHDLEPFWALPAAQIRKDAWDFEMTIHVRHHKASAGSDWFWTQIWLDLVRTLEHLLPDMDIALNAMDEPRIVVPWEDIAIQTEEAQRMRRVPKPEDIVTEFQELPAFGEDPEPHRETTEKYWERTGMSSVLGLISRR